MSTDLSVKDESDSEHFTDQALRDLITGSFDENRRIHLEGVDYRKACPEDVSRLTITLLSIGPCPLTQDDFMLFFVRRNVEQKNLRELLKRARDVMNATVSSNRNEVLRVISPDFAQVLTELRMLDL